MPDTTPTPAEVIARAKADPQALALLRDVIARQDDLWNAMRALERQIGHEINNLSETAQTFDVSSDAPDAALRQFMDELEIGGPVD
jgi:hypothetical protein